MGIKQFFRKIEKGTKDFFKKGGIAETGLRKAANTIGQAAAPLAKVGELAGAAAPFLAGLGPVGAAFGGGAAAFSQMAPKLSKALQTTGKTGHEILKGARANKGDIGGIVGAGADAIKNNIQKAKPTVQPYNVFDELPFA